MDSLTREDIALSRELISPPGDTLEEMLAERGISQKELAERMGRPLKTINEIIKAKAAITSDTAMQLEKALGASAQFWLARENNYRIELSELNEAEKNLDELEILKKIPLPEMVRVGWIPKTGAPLSNMDAVLRFFGVASVKVLPDFVLGKNRPDVRFKRDAHSAASDWAMAAWLRHGEREAENRRSLPPFDKKAFEAALFDIRELAMVQPVDFREKLVEFAASAGVAVVFSQNLKGAPVSGAARWVRGRPLIQLSGRFKTNDRFWFTVFHEAAHILLHDKKDAFIDEADGIVNDSVKEAQADKCAADLLIPAEKWAEMAQAFRVTEAMVLDFSARHAVHPGIVVGRLQKEGILKFSQLNRLKINVELFD